MNTFRFTADLERTLARAAETLALARGIQHDLEVVTPCRHPELLWRPNP